jgi:hypothetical protein
MTTVFDAARNGSGELVERSCAKLKRTVMSPRRSPGKLCPFKQVMPQSQKKRTRTGFQIPVSIIATRASPAADRRGFLDDVRLVAEAQTEFLVAALAAVKRQAPWDRLVPDRDH